MFHEIIKGLCIQLKNCCDEFTIDLVTKSKKTSEDKEYELQEVSENLYVFNTAAFVGKNSSGKTSAIELLECCYSILSEFCLEDKHYNYDNVKLEIVFYQNDYIFKYNTILKADPNLGSKANFTEQHIYRKKYYKSKVKEIYTDDGFEELIDLGELPKDTSIVFFVLKRKTPLAVYFNCEGGGMDTYRQIFRAMNTYKISKNVLTKVIKIFDDNVKSLEMVDEKHYKIAFQDDVKELSDSELIYMLSSGTTKGVLLYIHLDNMYESYNIRSELLKSRQFYNNAFDTSVNYEDLIALKKELMR